MADVPVTTLDDYYSQHDLPPVRFIKCDVQDHEVYVLRGGVDILRRDRPTLLVEQTEPCLRNGALRSLLTDLGYRGYFFVGNKLASMAELPGPGSTPCYLNYVYRFEGRSGRTAA